MKKIKVDITKALATGVFNLYETDCSEEYILVIVYSDGEFILPIITGEIQKAYIDPTIEEPIADVLGNLFTALIKHEHAFVSSLGCTLKTVKAIQSPAPEHSHKITDSVYTRGLKISLKAKEALTKAGYVFVPHDSCSMYDLLESLDHFDEYTDEVANIYNFYGTFTGVAVLDFAEMKKYEIPEGPNVIVRVVAAPQERNKIVKVIAAPSTRVVVVHFDDGLKEVVHCSKEDQFDVYVGVAIAEARHKYKTTSKFHKVVDEVLTIVKPKAKKTETAPKSATTTKKSTKEK